MKTALLGIMLFILLGIVALFQFSWLSDLQMREQNRLQNQLMRDSSKLIAQLQDELFYLSSLMQFRETDLHILEEKVLNAIFFWEASSLDNRLYSHIYLISVDDSPVSDTFMYDEMKKNRSYTGSTFEIDESQQSRKISRFIQQKIANNQLHFSSSLEYNAIDKQLLLVSPLIYPHEYILVAQIDEEILSQSVIPHIISSIFDEPLEYRFRITAQHTNDLIYSSEKPSDSSLFLYPDISLPVIFNVQERRIRVSSSGFNSVYDFLKTDNRVFSGLQDFFDMKVYFMLDAVHVDGSIEKASRRATFAFSLGNIGVVIMLAIGMIILLRNLQKSQKLSRQQNEFIATVTHELKTPIAVISAAAQNLSAGIITDAGKIASYGKMIEREGTRLKNSIDYFLLYANMNSSARLHFTSCDINKILHASLAQSNELIEQLHFTVEMELVEATVFVIGDAAALQTVFHNMIHNVLKHARNGLYLKIKCTIEKKGKLHIYITDHGYGISAKEQKNVFDAFVRGSRAMKNQIEGNGIGLNLVKRIVLLHEGSIRIHESSARGTTFCIVLPIEVKTE